MVKPLEYNQGLSLEEAKEKYNQVREEFERVKSHYSGLFGRFKKNISKQDSKTLTDCVGVLLPLELEASVQEQYRLVEGIGEALPYQIAQLNWQIMLYLSNFKNTWITRYNLTEE